MNITSALVLYESLSGNTASLAANISETLTAKDVTVERLPLRQFLDLDPEQAEQLVNQYEMLFIGAYTDSKHEPPEPIEELMETYRFPHHQIAAFGTGDTQWGDSYCLAADVVAAHYKSPFPVLKIEQMPARSDERAIENWLEAMNDESSNAASGDHGTCQSREVNRDY